MRPPSALLLAALALLALPAEGAEAAREEEPLRLPLFGESSFAATSSTTARWRGENYDRNPFDDDFLSVAQRFDLVLQGESLRFDLRLDGFTPFFGLDGTVGGTPQGSRLFQRSCKTEAQCYLQPFATVERALLRWDHDELTVEVGDAYAVLGRGLALSFRKADLLGVDNALRGAHLRWDDGTTLAALHAGVANPQNLDPLTLAYLPNPFDLVAGAELARKFGEDGALDVGLHGSAIRFEDLDSQGVFSSGQEHALVVGGVRAGAPALLGGALALYAEGNLLRRTVPLGGQTKSETGHGVYGSAQWQGQQLTALGEWVDYRQFVVANTTLEGTASRTYSSLPILELEGLQRVRAPWNRRGGSLKLDYAIKDTAWSVSLNGVAFGLDEDPEKDPWMGLLVTHGWVGLKRFNKGAGQGALAWAFEALAGARRETYLTDPQTPDLSKGDVDRKAVHAQVSGTLAKGIHSLEAKIDHRDETEYRFGGYSDFVQGGVTFTYTRALKFSISPTVRWSTERLDILAGRAHGSYAFLGDKYFPSLEARWNFTTSEFVSIFAGSTPGGRMCSGGVCRDVQPFEGVVASLVLRR